MEFKSSDKSVIISCAMDEFDFNVPINAEVIYDESDDENKPDVNELKVTIDATKLNPSVKKESTKTEESHILKTVDQSSNEETCIKSTSVNITTTQEKVQHYVAKIAVAYNKKHSFRKNTFATAVNTTLNNNYKKQQKPLDMPSLEGDCLNVNNHNTVENITNKGTDVNCETDNLKKRRISTSDKNKPPKKRNRNEMNMSNYNVDQEHDPNNKLEYRDPSQTNLKQSEKYSPECIQYAPSYTEVPLAEPQETNLSIPQAVNNIEINQNPNPSFIQNLQNPAFIQNQQTPNANMLSSQTQHNTNETVNYLKEILNTVSEHMIFIVNSYQSYWRVNKSGVEQSLIEHAKNNIIQTRNHFFDLSYSSVLNVIIPRMHDDLFVKYFINDTVKLAQLKSYPYTNDIMEPLFYQMIEWVKRRQKHIQSMNLNKVANSYLVQELNKPVQKSYKPPPPYPNEYHPLHRSDNNKHAVYPPGPPNTALHIEQSHLDKQNRQRQISWPTISSPQNSFENYNSHIYNTQQVNTPYTFTNTTQQNQMYNSQTTYQNSSPPWKKQTTQILTTPQARQKRKRSTGQKQTTAKSTYSFEDHLISLWEKQAQVCYQQPTQALEKEAPQLWQNNTSISHSSYHNQQEQMDTIMHSNQYLRPENLAQVEPNRSISRDSGFMSPLNFNSGADQLYSMPPAQEPTNQPATPLITHVTSLNPNVSYIEEGSCKVCGKLTKQKCIGCYKCYYCSHSCQYLDWHSHMAACK